MPDVLTLLIVCITLFFAGGIKGVVGLGLPTISLALFAMMFDLVTAIVLILFPSLVTNIWQAFSGNHGRKILKRIYPFIAMALLMIWLGAYTLSRLDAYFLSLLLGCLLIIYALISYWVFISLSLIAIVDGQVQASASSTVRSPAW